MSFEGLLLSTLDTPTDSEGQAAGSPDVRLNENSGAKISLSDEEIRAKENDIESEYADRELHVFDVKSFFQEQRGTVS